MRLEDASLADPWPFTLANEGAVVSRKVLTQQWHKGLQRLCICPGPSVSKYYLTIQRFNFLQWEDSIITHNLQRIGQEPQTKQCTCSYTSNMPLHSCHGNAVYVKPEMCCSTMPAQADGTMPGTWTCRNAASSRAPSVLISAKGL